ncbi:MAG: hypothetical protein FJ363_04120 [Gemmatimonadetes bacterium]|nr:hypothetical protein [Gemmatimonadota bacterium]
MTQKIGTLALAAALVLPAAGCIEDPVAPPPPPTKSELIHYWHFNNLPAGTLTSVAVDVTKRAPAEITYPGTGLGYMDNVDPGTDINARNNLAAGLGLRPRNPANTRALIIAAPTTGYKSIVVTWAAQRSSSGAQQEEFSYSVDGGTTWVPVGGPIAIAEAWEQKSVNLSAITAVENKANMRFRILFTGTGSDGASGNNRLDNITIEGIPLS